MVYVTYRIFKFSNGYMAVANNLPPFKPIHKHIYRPLLASLTGMKSTPFGSSVFLLTSIRCIISTRFLPNNVPINMFSVRVISKFASMYALAYNYELIVSPDYVLPFCTFPCYVMLREMGHVTWNQYFRLVTNQNGMTAFWLLEAKPALSHVFLPWFF